jgi:hypothetical protein
MGDPQALGRHARRICARVRRAKLAGQLTSSLGLNGKGIFMTTSTKRAAARLGIATAAIGASALLALPSAAGGASVSCRASALRFGTFEPSVANAAGAPCTSAQGSTPVKYGFDTGTLLRSVTTPGGHSGSASADVARLEDDGLVGPAALRLLGSDAYVSCQGGKPVVVGGSEPAGIDATSLAQTPAGLQKSVNVGGVVFPNEAVVGDHSSTFRALRIATPAGDVVAGESQAGYSGNPC